MLRQAKDTGRRNHAVANSEHEGIHSTPSFLRFCSAFLVTAAGSCLVQPCTALPPYTGITLLAEVAGTTVANDAYWRGKCTSIPSNALFLFAKKWDVIDFFKTVDEYSMLIHCTARCCSQTTNTSGASMGRTGLPQHPTTAMKRRPLITEKSCRTTSRWIGKRLATSLRTEPEF